MHRQKELRSSPDPAAAWDRDFYQSWAAVATFPLTGTVAVPPCGTWKDRFACS